MSLQEIYILGFVFHFIIFNLGNMWELSSDDYRGELCASVIAGFVTAFVISLLWPLIIWSLVFNSARKVCSNNKKRINK